MDVSIKRIDHLRVALNVSGILEARSKPEWKVKHQLGQRTYEDDSQSVSFCIALRATLPVAWQADVTLHCTHFNDTIGKLLRKRYPCNVDGPRADYMTAKTWQLISDKKRAMFDMLGLSL